MDRAGTERLIINTLTMLCKNSIPYQTHLKIQGLIGITVDSADVFLIQIDHRFGPTVHEFGDAASSGKCDSIPQSSLLAAKRPRMSAPFPAARRLAGRHPPNVVRRPRLNQQFMGSTGPAGVAAVRRQVPLRRPGGFTGPKKRTQESFAVDQTVSSVGSDVNQSINNRSASQPIAKAEPYLMGDGQQAYMQSSDVICVDSDEEKETANRKLSLKLDIEVDQKEALQAIFENALVEARACNPNFSKMGHFQSSSDSPAGKQMVQSSYIQGSKMEFSYGDGISSADMKPAMSVLSPSPMLAMVPSKQLDLQNSGDLLHSPTNRPRQLKMEMTADGVPRLSSNRVVCTPTRSPGHYASSQSVSPRNISPQIGTASEGTKTWTSVTETTFICTTAGCERRFTTKRAMIRHQKDKHGLVTRQTVTTGRAVEYDDDDDD